MPRRLSAEALALHNAAHGVSLSELRSEEGRTRERQRGQPSAAALEVAAAATARVAAAKTAEEDAARAAANIPLQFRPSSPRPAGGARKPRRFSGVTVESKAVSASELASLEPPTSPRPEAAGPSPSTVLATRPLDASPSPTRRPRDFSGFAVESRVSVSPAGRERRSKSLT